ncbi:MAG TPA: CoA transferase, partial [Acidimicrobiia bacterium]|nr:CoA transferase [Acidimicrobiia bacterium]
TKTRDEWVAYFEGHEVCFAPILTMSEARAHPHNVERATFTDVDGAPHPAPAPRFSRTSTSVQGAPVPPGAHTSTALTEWGFADADVAHLKDSGAIA